MHVSRLSLDGNSLVGLYAVALGSKVVVGTPLTDEEHKLISEVLGASIVQTTIAGTPLVGVFCATDGEKLAVPHTIFDHERKALDDAGIEYDVIPSILTCHGNNLAVTKHGMIVHPEYEQTALDKLEALFGVKPIVFDNADYPTIGSFISYNSTYALVSHDFSEDTLQHIADTLQLNILPGTINMGSTHIKSGIVCNDNGFLVGTLSGGPEVVNADTALGFLKSDSDDGDGDE